MAARKELELIIEQDDHRSDALLEQRDPQAVEAYQADEMEQVDGTLPPSQALSIPEADSGQQMLRQGALCATCQNMFSADLGAGMKFSFRTRYQLGHRYHSGIDGVRKASTQCFICNAVYNKVLSECGKDVFDTIFTACELSAPTDRHWKTGSSGSLYVEFTVPRDRAKPGDQDIREFQCHLAVLKIRHLDGCLPRGPTSSRTDHPEVFEMASSWIQTCLHNHPKCQRELRDINMPTRVLEIKGEAPESLRLICPADTGLKARYMTLSHVWGSAKFFKLNSLTYPQLLQGTQLSILPKTFQDAARVAARLGVEYLWIDSLCIFQNSDEDWRYESARMSDIYKGAFCNLAASGSADSTGGLFYSRIPEIVQPCVFSAMLTDLEAQEEFHIRHASNMEEVLHSNQPFFRRGWIVQERILSPRVLHFGQDQVSWECGTTIVSETYPEGPVQNRIITRYKNTNPLKFDSQFLSSPDLLASTTPEKVYDYWAKTVEHYSKCSITKVGDKLVAISGIAKEIHGSLGAREVYLAGLWSGDLLNRLTWHLRISRGIRPKQYRAPTWSWASVDGEVTMPKTVSPRGGFYTQVLGFKIDNRLESPFGQVTGGYLRLCGPLLTIVMTFHPGSLSTVMSGETLLTFSDIVQISWDVDKAAPKNLHYLPIKYEERLSGRLVEGLLLHPTKISGQFQRCGRLVLKTEIFETKSYPGWKWFKNEEWLQYESFDGFKNYTISIV